MPKIKWQLEADSSGFKRGTAEVANQVNRLSADLTGKLGGVGAVFSKLGPAGIAAAAAIGGVGAAIAAVTKLTIDATTKAADYADNLDAMATKTGLSIEALQQLEVAAKLGNSSLEAVATAVNKMQKELVGGSEAFKKLGLNIADVRKLDTASQLSTVAKAIDGLGSDADKAAARIAVFGRAGNDLAGTLKAAASGAADLGGLLSETAAKAAGDFKDKTDLLSTAWDRVVLQFGAAVAQSPELQQLFTDLTTLLVRAAETIERYADRISGFFNTMISGARETARRLRAEFPGLAAALGITGNSVTATGTNPNPVVPGGGRGFGGGDKPGKMPYLDTPAFMQSILDAQIAIWEASMGIGSPFQKGVANLGGQGNYGRLLGSLPGKSDVYVQTQFAIDDTAEAATKFDKALANLANTFQVAGIGADSLPGKILAGLQIGKGLGGLKGIGSLFGAGAAKLDFGKLLGNLPGLAGLASSAFGIGKAIFGFFKGPSKAEREADAKKAAEAAAAAASALAKAAKESRAQGIAGIMEFGPQFFMQRTITTEEDARKQGTLFAAAWAAVVKDEGIVAAATAFKDAFAKMKADMEAAGLTEPEWFKAIEGMMELGLDEEFRKLAESANTAAKFLDALAAAGILGPEAFRIFEEEARNAFEGGRARAIELGLDPAEATKAGFAAANPLLKGLLNQSILTKTQLSEDIQKLIDEAGIVPDVDFQQLDELRGIRKAVEKLAGVIPQPEDHVETPEEQQRRERQEERERQRGERDMQHGGVVTQWGVPAVLHGTPGNPEYVMRGSQLGGLGEASAAEVRALRDDMRRRDMALPSLIRAAVLMGRA